MAKFFKGLLITLLVLVLFVVVAVVGVYFVVKGVYGVDLIQTIDQVSTLNQPVDENSYCPSAYTNDDMASASAHINGSAPGIVVENAGDYSIDFNVITTPLSYRLALNGKQVGALAQTLIEQENDGKISFNGVDVETTIKQVEFNDLDGNGNGKIAVVLRLNMTELKNSLGDGFPVNIVKNFIPDNLYIKSSIKVQKGATAFSYTVDHDSLRVNNMSVEQTNGFFDTLNKLSSFGTAEKFNEDLGAMIMDALVGNETNKGFAYQLKSLGATDFALEQVSGENCFVVQIA
ncbi:MAG: hypothetical protein IJY70_01495 [Clostridia bacterium]|nr:hypothetical protein [Clostridia bacterium]